MRAHSPLPWNERRDWALAIPYTIPAAPEAWLDFVILNHGNVMSESHTRLIALLGS